MPRNSATTRSASLVLERADDEPVGLHEVGDRAALGEELRVRDVADAREAARRRAARGRARPCRPGTVLFITTIGCPSSSAGSRRRRSRRRAGRRRPTRSAACRRRRRGSPRPSTASRTSSVKRIRSRVPLEHELEAGLVDRHLARLQALDPLRDDVADDDLVPELGEAGAGHEADVAGAEHCDLRHGPRLLPEWLQALGDREHRLVRELVAQRVDDPVARTRACAARPCGSCRRS